MRTIEWRNGKVVTIDQTKLPCEEVTIEINNCNEMAEAIRTMKIRGAPLLGAAAAYALALTAFNSKTSSREALLNELEGAVRNYKANPPHRRKPVLGTRQDSGQSQKTARKSPRLGKIRCSRSGKNR